MLVDGSSWLFWLAACSLTLDEVDGGEVAGMEKPETAPSLVERVTIVASRGNNFMVDVFFSALDLL